MTQKTETIGSSHSAYCLLALLSNDAKKNLSQLLKDLSKEFGHDIWVMPQDSLHITLCEIIQSKDYAQDKQLIFDRHSNEYKNLTAKVLSKYSSISLIFDKIEVSPQAIIIQATDDGSFANIRRELVEVLPLPNETKMPPTIIHSSIARFVNEVPLSKVEAIIQKYSVNMTEIVSEFQLIHSTITPLLKYEVIRRYPLNNTTNKVLLS